MPPGGFPDYDDPAQRRRPAKQRNPPYPLPPSHGEVIPISQTSSLTRMSNPIPLASPSTQTPLPLTIQIPGLPPAPPPSSSVQPPSQYPQSAAVEPLLQAATGTPSVISAGLEIANQLAPPHTLTNTLRYWREKSEAWTLMMDVLVALTAAYNWRYECIKIVGELRPGVDGNVDIVGAQVYIRGSFFLGEVKDMFRRAHLDSMIDDTGMFLNLILQSSSSNVGY